MLSIDTSKIKLPVYASMTGSDIWKEDKTHETLDEFFVYPKKNKGKLIIILLLVFVFLRSKF